MAAEAEAIEEAVARVMAIPADELGRLFWDSEEGCSDWAELKAEHDGEDPEDRDTTQYAGVCRAMEKMRARIVEAIKAG